MRACLFGLLWVQVNGDAPASCKDFDISKLDSSHDGDFCLNQLASGKKPQMGDVCLAHPEDLLPTQAARGEVQASCKQTKLEKLASKNDGGLKAYLESHQVPAVLGPAGKVYMTDHHHLSVALLGAFLPYEEPKPHRTLFVCVQYDYSSHDTSAFWAKMIEEQLVYLFDEKGTSITAAQLPTSVKDMRDNPYRTLSEWVRDSYGYVKCGKKGADKHFPQCSAGTAAKPFMEFHWADAFRKEFVIPNIYAESNQEQVIAFKAIMEDVMKFALSANNSGLDGWNAAIPQHTKKLEYDSHGCEVKTSILV